MSEGSTPDGSAGGSRAGQSRGADAPAWTAPGSAPPTASPGAAAHPVAGDAAHPVAGAAAYLVAAPGWGTALVSHKPGIIPLRPLRLGDVVEGGFAALRRNPRTLLGLTLLTLLAVLLVAGALFLAGYLLVSSLEGSDALDTLVTVGLTTSVAVLLFLGSATSTALAGILAHPVAEAVLGRYPSMGETWRHTRRAVPRLVGLCAVLVVTPTVVLAAVVGLAVWGFAGGLPGLGVAGVAAVVAVAVAATWLGIRLSLATPALVLEDLGVAAALRRSWALTSALFWRTFVILAASTVLIGIVQYVLSVAVQVTSMVVGAALSSALGADSSDITVGIALAVASVAGVLVSGVVTQPFLAAVLTLLYTDGRIRKEGFDLALVGAAVPPTGVPVR